MGTNKNLIKRVLLTNSQKRTSKTLHNNLVVLALGSNMGDRILNIKRAIHKVPLTNKVVANFYETKALLPEKHYLTWDKNYFNTVMYGYCNLPPLELLRQLKTIECFLGRKKHVRWSPRIIDIDILFYKNLQINHKKLQIPHPEIKNREFVLLPLKDILCYHGAIEQTKKPSISAYIPLKNKELR